MAVGDIYESDIQYHVHERPLHLGLWWRVTGNPSTVEATAHDLAGAIVSTPLIDMLIGIVSSFCRFDQVRVYKRVDNAGISAIGPVGRVILDNKVGTRPGDALPDNAPLLINFQQIAISSKANGRAFLSGISEDDVAKNVITDAFRTGAVATFISNWESTLTNISGADGGTYAQCMMSKHPDAPAPVNATYGAPLDVTSVSVSPIIRQQRRRQTRWEGTET